MHGVNTWNTKIHGMHLSMQTKLRLSYLGHAEVPQSPAPEPLPAA